MELRHLRYAVAVAESGSFTRAAARLHLAQQALSQQVADLERELQAVLFHRSPRGVSPTAAGLAFLEAARATLAQSDRAVAAARNGPRATGGRLTVGLHLEYEAFEPVVFEAFARLRDTASAAEVLAQRVEPHNAVARLRRRTLDAAITHLAPDEEENDLAAELLWVEHLRGVLLPATHPLAQQQSLRLADLGELPFLAAPRPGGGLQSPVFSALTERGVIPRPSRLRFIGSRALLIRAVARGWGWALGLPGDGSAHGVLYRPLADPPIALRLWLLYRQETPSLLLHSLLRCARESRRALGQDREPRGDDRAEAASGVGRLR